MGSNEQKRKTYGDEMKYRIDHEGIMDQLKEINKAFKRVFKNGDGTKPVADKDLQMINRLKERILRFVDKYQDFGNVSNSKKDDVKPLYEKLKATEAVDVKSAEVCLGLCANLFMCFRTKGIIGILGPLEVAIVLAIGVALALLMR